MNPKDNFKCTKFFSDESEETEFLLKMSIHINELKNQDISIDIIKDVMRDVFGKVYDKIEIEETAKNLILDIVNGMINLMCLSVELQYSQIYNGAIKS